MTNTVKTTTIQEKGALKAVGLVLIVIGCIFLAAQILGLFTGAPFCTLKEAAMTPAEKVQRMMGDVCAQKSDDKAVAMLEDGLGLSNEEVMKLLKRQYANPEEKVLAVLEQVKVLPEEEAVALLEKTFDLPAEELAEHAYTQADEALVAQLCDAYKMHNNEVLLGMRKNALTNTEALAEMEVLYAAKHQSGALDFLYYYVTVQGAVLLVLIGCVLKNLSAVSQSLRSNELHKTIGQVVMLLGAFLLFNTLMMALTGQGVKFFPMWQVPLGCIMLGWWIARFDKMNEKMSQEGLFYGIGYVLVLLGAFFALNFFATIITGGKLISFLPYYITLQFALGLIVLGVVFKSLNKITASVEEKGARVVIGWAVLGITALLGVNWLAMSLLGKVSGVATFPALQILVVQLALGLAICKWDKILAAYKKGGARFVLSWLCLIVGVFMGVELLLKGILTIMDEDKTQKLYAALVNDKSVKFKKTTSEYGMVFIQNFLKSAVLWAGSGAALFVLIRKFAGWRERTFTEPGYKLTQIGKALHSIALCAYPFTLVYALILFLDKGWQQALQFAGICTAGLLVAWVTGVALNALGLVAMRNEKEALKDVVVSWTCDECGAENPISIVKCKNCGHINP